MGRLIDADKLEKALIAEKNINYSKEWYSVANGLGIAITLVKDTPTEDVLPKAGCGKWEIEKGTWGLIVRCSNCGARFDEPMIPFAYCPNCGAEMGENNEDV